jgi:hypothetical protein
MFWKHDNRFSKPSWAGLIQALGVLIYCGFVAAFLWAMNNFFIKQPSQFFGVTMMLVLLVFSAAITGFLVFGYSVALLVDKKIKEALAVLGYTLTYLLFAFLIILLLLML